jgi:hypothetical protein
VNADDGRRAATASVPLARPLAIRALVAGGLVLGALTATAASFFLLLWLFAPAMSLAVLGVLAAAPFVASAILAARWSSGWLGAVQMASSAVVVLACAVVAVFGTREAIEALGSRSTLATPAEEAGLWLAAVAIAALGIAALVAVLPLSLRRATVTFAAAATTILGLASGGAAVAVTVGQDSCDDFEFDRGRWRAALGGPDPVGERSKAELMADAIVRCGTVDDATRAEVERRLGKPDRRGRQTWEWGVGMTNDALGPGDAESLVVTFGRDGRVSRAEL